MKEGRRGGCSITTINSIQPNDSRERAPLKDSSNLNNHPGCSCAAATPPVQEGQSLPRTSCQADARREPRDFSQFIQFDRYK